MTTTAAPFPAARFIKEIGRGVNGARALPREDAQALFDAMLAGRVSDLELGAILMAYRIKGEAPHELAGMLEAAHAHCQPLPAPPDRQVVVIPSYNGARKQPNLVPLLALLLAREGIPVLVHGTREFEGRVTSMALFEALGVPLCASTGEASAKLRDGDANGPLAVLPVDVLSPGLSRLLERRTVIGLRNSSHTVAKMLQPVGEHTPAEGLRLYSYTHPEYRETLTDYFSHEPANVLLARGTEGEVVADARRTGRIDWLHEGHQQTLVGQAGGSIGDVPELPPGSDAGLTVAWIRRVLDGAVPVPAPITIQIEAIRECLRQGTRVTWASPV
ncbi:DNA-binding protein YbiB [Cupriavidus alkaliphilus]|uniref:DNA-binding protein YbiB n=1 Tax=Cupriavidus alkaliphilus TaxID=942866 RepID=UPI000815763F|nr:DNA-binding protein YbiB [Cupriavidus alkaliphilus]MBB2918605.1 anthranilate phosphoribosyltransferase [Cupriavidus alkaliphilus]PVY80534.1 anthranilate phosphoribosyltransferase [Cupriavidus alkaliphilus]RAS12520.1 anthranilate phosphoribosyltransferase [Cupriavidus alkaliphilus]SCB11489.1 anthranilate phosphoribosyltransferase [Cupriavidus alkaliphilus]